MYYYIGIHAIIIIFHAAARLTKHRNSTTHCPNERVVFECTVDSGVLEWRITPRSQNFKEKTFIKNNSPLNSRQEMSWLGLSTTVWLTYTSSTSSTMTSTAEVTASSEFHEALFTCSGDSATSQHLLIAGKYNTCCSSYSWQDYYWVCSFASSLHAWF